MPPAVLLICYCLLIVLASLAGGWLPSIVHLNHRRMQLMVSYVGGLMLGIALFHLLPHALRPGVGIDRAVAWLMTGLLGTFFLIRVFHSHQHEHGIPATPETPSAAAAALSPEALASGSSADESAAKAMPPASDHQQHHAAEHGQSHHGLPRAGSRRYGWVGVACGLALHTAIDGVALAASVYDGRHTSGVIVLGLGPFLAVLLHKPLDALSITSLMAASGWPRGVRQLVNMAYASMCPLGALLFYFGVTGASGGRSSLVVGCALAFSAGVFLCISLGDLLPEVTFHAHDRVKLSCLLLLGVATAYAIVFLEGSHMHPPQDMSNAAAVMQRR